MRVRAIANAAAGLLATAAVAVLLAGCSSSPGTPNAAPQTTIAASTTAAASAVASSSAAATSSPSGPTAAQQAFAGKMTAAGFFPGTPSYLIDADADAVCGSLQTESMSTEIAYEESVDENTTTGMTTKSDILLFVRDSVKAFCPQYAKDLPAS